MKIGYSFFAGIVFVSWRINRCWFSMWFSWEDLRVMINSTQLKIHATHLFTGVSWLRTRCHLHIRRTRWEINFRLLICRGYKAPGRNALLGLTKVLKTRKEYRNDIIRAPFPLRPKNLSTESAALFYVCILGVFNRNHNLLMTNVCIW